MQADDKQTTNSEEKNETRRANNTPKHRQQTEMRMRVVHGEDFQ